MSQRFNWLLVIALVITFQANAQNTLHPTSSEYEYPTDPKVVEKLEQWRDQKFGILIHGGIYAVPRIVESWSIVNEDWINRKDTTQSYEEYKKWYWGLSEKFNPTGFDPTQWADAAQKAGMKYVVFTTKHHDGFNMFDNQFTDYKISNGPFKNNPKADVAKYVFDAFREKDMMIGDYFSKPDWHSQYYWWDYRATLDRNVNYDIRKHPWRWNQYVQFTHNQLNELTTNYGDIDIFWIDGGWVRPLSTVNEIGIVAKGGNLLVGVGPTAEGLFLIEQVSRLEEIGKWVEVNGAGIYDTRAIENFQDEKLYFTQGKAKEMYALMPLEEGEKLGESILDSESTKEGSKITALGENKPLRWKTENGKTVVSLPKNLQNKLSNSPAIVLTYVSE
ncbi:alpha-L-fucosidase [Algoriphagus aquimarinus]|uniref:alpha-L-fucosidase n=1 Tax=Algoriphagus aquimarinus TaxID=237018 RepID=UPI0030DAA94B|tara:strand:- start:6806 stop:7972 length:1167 start_codon:yes stop_codon:yes gene_type:complete